MNTSEESYVTRSEALELIFENWQVNAGTEMIPVHQALGRINAADIFSQNTLPLSRVSQCDGIAVRFADFVKGLPATAGWTKGVDYVQADTGDDFPDAFDTIIPAERINYDHEGRLILDEDLLVSPGDRVRKAGSFVKERDLLLEAGAKLAPVHMAILAMGGIHQLEVIKKPKVVYIPTGSELIPAGLKPERGQNIECNGLMVMSFLEEWGAEPVSFPIIKDQPAELEQALDLALNMADIVLINGGTSKGAEDYNADLLEKRASCFRHGIRVIPAKPLALAIIDGKPVVNMPGPTNATFLAMDWCVSQIVSHFLGLKTPQRPRINARLDQAIEKRPDFEQYTRFTLVRQDGKYIASPVAMQNSVPYMLARTDALFVAPIGVEGFEAGDEIEIELLCGLDKFGYK